MANLTVFSFFAPGRLGETEPFVPKVSLKRRHGAMSQSRSSGGFGSLGPSWLEWGSDQDLKILVTGCFERWSGRPGRDGSRCGRLA